MEIHTVGLFVALFCAAYIQSLTGFAFGMIAMSTVILLDLAPVTATAIIISFSGLLNSSMGFLRYRHYVQWRRLVPLVLTQGPGIFLGIELLLYLSKTSLYALELLMGSIVVAASLSMIVNPPRLSRTSGIPAFASTGFASGIMTGLFTAGGPPLVFLFYRQPWIVSQIKACLFTIFTLSTVMRLGFVSAQGDLIQPLIFWGLASLPVVYLGSWMGVKLPLPLSEHHQKRFAFCLFGLMGVLLALSGLRGLLSE